MWADHWTVNIGYACMTVFLALSFYVMPSVLHFKRIWGILAPWLVWCAFFKALDVFRARDISALFTIHDPFSLLIGPATHLWYLPYVALATFLLSFVSSRQYTPRSFVVACCIAVVPTTIGLWAHGTGALPQPLYQWSLAVGATLLGFLVGRGRPLNMAGLPVAMIIAICSVFWLSGYTDWPPFGIAGTLVFYGATHLKTSIPFAKKLGVLSFGIYLIHPFFMLVWYRFFPHGTADALGVVAVFTAAALATLIMRRIPVVKSFI